MEATGAYLRELRKRNKLSQVALAEKIKVHSKTIERWEAGRNVPEGENLLDVLAVLGGDPETFDYLRRNPQSKAADGQRAAENAADADRVKLLDPIQLERAEALFADDEDLDVEELLNLARDLKRQKKLRNWIWYGRGMAATDD